jgi:tRNA threonylcarbamoyladenosine biosynthesis protein TsaB
MKTLALELSSARGSIAFVDGEVEQFSCDFANDRKHSGAFFEQLQRCLRACGSPDRIVVGLGPGSYAGTRIAIAAATGLQLALGSTLAGVPSLCGLPTDAREYAVIGDARRGSFYFARVVERTIVEGPILCSEAELRDHMNVQLPIFSTEPLFEATVLFPSARVLAQIAAPAAELLEPIYLREPHITVANPVPFAVTSR